MTGEPEGWVEKAVESVQRSLSASHIGEKGMYLCPGYHRLMATWNNSGFIPICTSR